MLCALSRHVSGSAFLGVGSTGTIIDTLCDDWGYAGSLVPLRDRIPCLYPSDIRHSRSLYCHYNMLEPHWFAHT